MHAAHRSVGISGGPSSQRADLTGVLAWDGGSHAVQRVCLASAAPLDESLAVLAAIGAWLEERGIARCEPASWSEGEPEGLSELLSCDRAVFLADGAALDQPPPEALRQFAAAGKPMAVLGRDAERFLAWMRGHAIDSLTIGGGDPVALEVTPSPAADGHPLLEGVGRFAAHGIFGGSAVRRDGHLVLLRGATPHGHGPVAWLDGSTFVTTLGAAADLRIGTFRRLLGNAIAAR